MISFADKYSSNRITLFVASLLFAAACILLGYFTKRENFISVLTLYSFLFLVFFFLYNIADDSNKIRLLIILGLTCRLLLLVSTPNLSDDFFRFIWDGHLMHSGINPFNKLPDEIPLSYYSQAGLTKTLFSGMNSPHYYTIYPPVLQGIFYAAAFFKSSITGSILIMKLFIFAAECGSTLLFVKLLDHYKMPSKNVLLFVLNPLVIIELSGNIHFEGIMLFFLLFSIWLLITKNIFLSSVMFSLAVCTKLLPLMFLPLIVKAMGIRKGSNYCFAVLILTAILWLPFLNIEFAGHLFSSIGLYFHNFEFNAGIYYLARWIGYKFSGYNLIAFCGPLLSFVSFLLIIILSFMQHKIRNDFKVLLLILSAYFLLSTTVHPWYITSLVGFSVMTNFRFAITWSFLVCVSYSAYQTIEYHENLLFTGIEYIIIFSWAAIELFTKRKKETDSVVYIFEKQ